MSAIQMSKTKSHRSSVFLLVLFHAVACHSSSSDHPRPPAPPRKETSKGGGSALFVFGDSYLDVGNNNYFNTSTLDQANFRPYGNTFFHKPTGRFSDGRIVPDFIAEHAKLSTMPPFLQLKVEFNISDTIDHIRRSGINFASGGAGALVETFRGSVIDLKMQLQHFTELEMRLRMELGQTKAQVTLWKAVYLVCIGSNDYMSPFLTNSTIINSFNQHNYVEMVMGNLTTFIKDIYDKGGRKFGFINLPPLGCLPGLRVMKLSNHSTCLAEPSALAKAHNRALSRLLVKLEDQLKGFKYSLYDFNHFVTQRINQPSHYGFIEGKEACCGTGKYRGVYSCGGKRIVKEYELCENPSSYLFWDSFHLTDRAYNQLADDMWSTKTRNDRYTLRDLFQGH